MSGYLQRLATAATSSPIHPVVRPMFSGPRQDPVADETDRMDPQDQRLADRRQDLAASQPPSATRGEATRGPQASPVAEPATRPEHSPQPMAERAPADVDVLPTDAAPDVAAPSRDVAPIRARASLAAPERESVQPEARRDAAVDAFVPLLPLVAPPDARGLPLRDEPAPAQRRAATGLARHAHDARPSTRTSEEVQIHIGRIEVTAVAPPPAPPPARQRHGAMSLADYLKQRNGRAP